MLSVSWSTVTPRWLAALTIRLVYCRGLDNGIEVIQTEQLQTQTVLAAADVNAVHLQFRCVSWLSMEQLIFCNFIHTMHVKCVDITSRKFCSCRNTRWCESGSMGIGTVCTHACVSRRPTTSHLMLMLSRQASVLGNYTIMTEGRSYNSHCHTTAWATGHAMAERRCIKVRNVCVTYDWRHAAVPYSHRSYSCSNRGSCIMI